LKLNTGYEALLLLLMSIGDCLLCYRPHVQGESTWNISRLLKLPQYAKARLQHQTLSRSSQGCQKAIEMLDCKATLLLLVRRIAFETKKVRCRHPPVRRVGLNQLGTARLCRSAAVPQDISYLLASTILGDRHN
jgi:hypothetical protein